MNFEMSWAFSGHFLLTNLLLEDLKRGAAEFGEARVVNVASMLHDPEASKRTRRKADIGASVCKH